MVTVTAELAGRAIAAVAALDDVAAEIVARAEYEANGPIRPYPAWALAAGDRVAAHPDYDTVTGPAETVRQLRVFTEAAVAEYPDDGDAARAVLPLFAGVVSSCTRPGGEAMAETLMAELLPPYVKQARAGLTA